MFVLQIPPPPVGSIDPFVGWLLALIFGSTAAAISKMYFDSRGESKRKDDLIDRLLMAGLENADANKRSVSLIEEERRHR